MTDSITKIRQSNLPIRNNEGFEILPYMKKQSDIFLKKLRF